MAQQMEQYLDEKSLCGRLSISRKTAQAWRWRGTGPQFFKVGRAVRYKSADVEQWLESNRCQNTSQRGVA